MPKRKVAECRTEERVQKFTRVLEKRTDKLTIVLENVHDPHNVSAVIRSCDAVGILEISLVYHSGQVFPTIERSSSASAKKWVNQRHYTNIEDCYNDLRKEGKKIYATNMSKDAVSLYSMDLTQPVALVFGNEHAGVSEVATKLADGNFLIPQVGLIQSLNISVACAVSLFEAFRQRQQAGLYEQNQFESEVFNKLLEEWLSK